MVKEPREWSRKSIKDKSAGKNRVSVRRIFPRTDRDVAAELTALGCHPDGTVRMLPKSRMVLLKITDLSAPAAHILKQTALSLGGDAAVHRELITGQVQRSEALLMLTQDRVEPLCQRLQTQQFGLPDLARQIEMILALQMDQGRSFWVRDRLYQRIGRPFIMGILNVTPDSFSDGGRFIDQKAAIAQAHQLEDEGADFIDVGGESSRPGSQPVSAEEEELRVMPVIEALIEEIHVPLSIDTTKALVARSALEAGVRIVNDITALRGDEDMIRVAMDYDATVVLMHMLGEPRTMQQHPGYSDLIGEIHDFLAERVDAALDAGIIEDRIIVDPGIGFGKRPGDNFELIGRLREFGDLGPVLVGPSRKAFIGKALDLPVEERLYGTAGAAAVAVMNGADIIRVHDVKPIVEVAEIVYQCLTRTETRENPSQT